MTQNTTGIEHEGIVRSNCNNSVTVSIVSASACSGCHAAGICSLSGKEEKIIEVPGRYSVRPGENVKVLMTQSQGYTAVLLGYVLPMVLVVSLLTILVSVPVPELTAGIAAVSILLPYYLIIYFFRNRINRKFTFSLKET